MCACMGAQTGTDWQSGADFSWSWRCNPQHPFRPRGPFAPLRRLTFLSRKVSKRSLPCIRPCTSLRCVPGPLAPSVLQGSTATGHPCPGAAFAASLPLNPLRTDYAHPPDGDFGVACATGTSKSSTDTLSSGFAQILQARAQAPSGGRVQVLRSRSAGMDAGRGAPGHGGPVATCLWSSAGAREARPRSGLARMQGAFLLGYFFLPHCKKK
jgi:hypothetical protein